MKEDQTPLPHLYLQHFLPTQERRTCRGAECWSWGDFWKGLEGKENRRKEVQRGSGRRGSERRGSEGFREERFRKERLREKKRGEEKKKKNKGQEKRKRKKPTAPHLPLESKSGCLLPSVGLIGLAAPVQEH